MITIKTAKKQKLKENKGITLIALVITIIVLLILAGVTIATLTGDNGILTKANEAKTITNEKDEEEQIEIGYTEYLMADQTGEKVNFEVSEAAVTGKEGDWIIRFNKTGKEYYFDGETITKVTWKQEEDTITNIETKQTLKVGDYVDYDPTLEANASDLTYTSKTDKTGADSDQEFNAETYKNAEYGWRILGVSKGKLRLISGEFVGAGNYTNGSRTYYTLKGKKGCINGIEELNKISAIFGHGKGAEKATSITAEDINEITGYDPAKAKCEEGNFNEYGNKVTYTKEGETKLSSRATNGQKWSGTQSTLNYYDKSNKTFKTLTSGSTQITSTYYYYNPTTLNTKQEKPTQGVDENGVYNTIYQILFGKYAVNTDSYEISFVGTGTQPRYWLASESANTVTNGVNWGLRRVNDGKVYNRGIYFSSGTEYSYDDFGVRPIVYLKSDISLEWNNTLQKWKIK